MTRVIRIESCKACPHQDYRNSHGGQVDWVPVCRKEGRVLHYAIRPGSDDRMVAAPTYVIPDWCRLKRLGAQQGTEDRFDLWWNSPAADSLRARHPDADGEQFRPVWEATHGTQVANPLLDAAVRMKAALEKIVGQEQPNRWGYDAAGVALNDEWRAEAREALKLAAGVKQEEQP